MSPTTGNQAEWRVAWCAFCSAGMRLNAKVCPNCKLSPECLEKSDEPPKVFTRVWLHKSLEMLVPDFHDLVRSLPQSEFQSMLNRIVSTSLEDIDNDIAQQLLETAHDLQLVGFSTPGDILRTLIFELFLELSQVTPSSDELERPVLKALKIDAMQVSKELERRAMQSELPDGQYRPLPALEIDNEKELIRKVLIYLATLDALSGIRWQDNFQRSLKDGELNEEEIDCELRRWRQLLDSDMQPTRPDSPWRQTLKMHGEKTQSQPDERSFVCTASLAETRKFYSMAEDIARASLRLLDSASDTGSTAGAKEQRERLKLLAKGVIASCCGQEKVESEQSAAQSAFYESLKRMIIDTLIPKDLQDPELLKSLSGMDSALDIAVADNLVKQKERRHEAVLKYNRAIFAAKETIEQVRKKGYKASKEDTARAKVEQLLLIKSLTKLAEIKFQDDEFSTSEQYLLSAARHLDEYDLYSRGENADHPMHSPLRPAIFGSLGLIYLHQAELGRACRALKRAKQALKSTQPMQMLGFMISYEGVLTEYEQLRSRLAS